MDGNVVVSVRQVQQKIYAEKRKPLNSFAPDERLFIWRIMMKAELRFIDGDYYITQGDKKILAQEYAEVDSVIVNMPDGTELVIENLAGKTIMTATYFLADTTLIDEGDG